MPEIAGTLRPPRLPSAPSSPALGQMYYDTTTNILYYWDGSSWVSTRSSAGTIYDSDQIGVVKTWAGRTAPTNWKLADGARYTQAAFPQGYAFAKAEADAGNPLWTYRITPDISFTVPNLNDKFILAPGANLLGATGGEAAHLLTTTEAAQKAVTSGNENADHHHDILSVNGNAGYATSYLDGNSFGNGTTGVNVYSTGGVSTNHQHAIAGSSAATAHNNLPPYVVVAQIVKIAGATIDSGGALVGPPGAAGSTGPAGPGVPVGGTVNQVLAKKTTTDYDTQWVAQTGGGGSGLPEVYIGPDPPTPRDQQVIWIDTDESPAASLNMGMDVWHIVGTPGEPPFLGTWGAAGEGVRFRKDPDGRVWVRGNFTGGTAATSAFTLPPGYRPPRDMYFDALASAGASGNYTSINTAGNVVQNAVGCWVDVSFDTETVSQVASVAAQPLDRWHNLGDPGEPTFTNGSQYAGFLPVGFRKDPFGRVHLRGMVQGTFGSGTTLFTLPAGYRPTAVVLLDAIMGTPGQCRIDISAAGAVVVNATANSWISLDGLYFDTDTLTTYSTGAIIPSAQSMPVSMDAVHIVGATGEPAFQNSWVAYDVARTVRFRKFPDGRVRLAGAVKGGVVGNVVFTLPPGYRPPSGSSQDFMITSVAAGNSGVVAVSDTGAVTVNAGHTTYTGLFGIEFDTETTLVTASIAAQPVEAWHLVGASGEPAFQSSWVNVGSTSSVAGYRKFPDGRVRLRGTVKGGADFSTIFTLPAGYRPPATAIFPMPTADGASVTWVQINAAGVIQMGDVGSAAQASYLDGVEFDTETVSNYATAVVQGATPAINPVVSTLPVSPVDGQEVYYRFVPNSTPANLVPVIWHLKWDATISAWLPAGAQEPAMAADWTNPTVSMGSGAWGTFNANDPIARAPLAGIYELETGLAEYSPSAASHLYLTYTVNGGAVQTAALEIAIYLGPGNGHGKTRITLAAGDAIRQLYYLNSAGPQNVRLVDRYVSLRPVRVG